MGMVNKWRIYIKPFNIDGTYQTDYIDITRFCDLSGIDTIEQNLDNTDYQIGIYRNSSITLLVNNNGGEFSDVGEPNTLFKYTRANSLVKVTWEVEEDGAYCGTAICGSSYLSEETTMFIGLLNDDSASMDVNVQEIAFTVLGREEIFEHITVQSDVVAGDLISAAMYKILNNTRVTSLLTLSALNITCGADVTLDSVTDLTNQTGSAALNDLLLISNSVLYISGDTIYIQPRTATVAVQETFYGQASLLGPENIQDLKNIRTGLHRTFNYLLWEGVPTISQDTSSVALYGVKKKTFDFTFITDGTKQTTLLAAIKAEFKDPKQEIDMYTPLNYDTLAVDLLDRVAIDYPTVFRPVPGGELPICGLAICGEAQLPYGEWAFTIDTSTNYKVIGKSLDVANSLYKFKLREI